MFSKWCCTNPYCSHAPLECTEFEVYATKDNTGMEARLTVSSHNKAWEYSVTMDFSSVEPIPTFTNARRLAEKIARAMLDAGQGARNGRTKAKSQYLIRKQEAEEVRGKEARAEDEGEGEGREAPPQGRSRRAADVAPRKAPADRKRGSRRSVRPD
jgi:hypothetical protein